MGGIPSSSGGGSASSSAASSIGFGTNANTYNITPASPPTAANSSWLIPALIGGGVLAVVGLMFFLKGK